MARRLVARGDTVEWFTAAFPGAAASEDLDGVRVVRRGRQWTVHWQAFRNYRRRLRERFDLVVDEVNTVPFFTPLWARIPSCMLMFQLAREVWWYESPFPLSAVGYALEPIYLRLYRRVPVFTISESTAQDLRKLGFVRSIRVVPVGLEPMSPPQVQKEQVPTFLYVGRLAPSKRVLDIIRAFAEFKAAAGPAQLWLVGEGPAAYLARLHRWVQRNRLEPSVRFWGRLAAYQKHRLMAQSYALLVTSAREGWGLVVTEANACGTPAIVYDVAGLRDSVRNEQTGLVVPASPDRLATGMLRLWRDPDLYQRLATEAQAWSRTFSFDTSAHLIRDGIVQALDL